MINWKDVFVRAGKTFIEAFVPMLVAALAGVDFSVPHVAGFWVTVLVSVAAGAFTIAWNVILEAIKPTKEK
jgi:hypothetical protein